MNILNGKRAVLFDLGGTLIEFEGRRSWSGLEADGMIKCHKYLTNLGYELPNADEFALQFAEHHHQIWEDISKNHREIMFDKRLSGFLAKFEIDLGNGIDKLVKEFYTVVSEQIEPIDGANDVLTAVAKRNLNIGLVSNSPFIADWHRNEMKRLGIYEFFDYTIFSSEFGIRKPDPAIFRDCLDHLEAEPSEAVHIGDRPREDIAGANGLSITSVLIRRHDRKLPSNIKPDYIIDKITDIIFL